MATPDASTYCRGLRLKFPSVVEVVGIASEPLTESASSQEFLYVDLGEPFDAEEATKWREMMVELDVQQSPTVKAVKGKSHEFPMPFNFSQGPKFYSAENGMPMNRAARRAMAKQARSKRR